MLYGHGIGNSIKTKLIKLRSGDNCQGWSATIPGWSPVPRMVTHHPKSVRLGIWHIDHTHKIKTRLQLPDVQPPFFG